MSRRTAVVGLAVVLAATGCASADGSAAPAAAGDDGFSACSEAVEAELTVRGIEVPVEEGESVSFFAYRSTESLLDPPSEDAGDVDLSGSTAGYDWECTLGAGGGQWTVTSLVVGPDAGDEPAPEIDDPAVEPTFEPSGPPPYSPPPTTSAG